MLNLVRTALLLGVVAVLAGMAGWAVGGIPAAVAGAALGLAAGGAALLRGARVVLRLYGAREVSADALPHLFAMVRDLAARAGLPAPRVFVLDDAAANAFVVGLGRAHAGLVLTDGILRLLDERELRAVLAHEFAHILRGDILPGTLAATLGGVLAAAAQAGLGAPGQDAGGSSLAPLWLLLAPLAALLAHLGAAARRELAADRVGAGLCGDPAALVAALQRLQAHAQVVKGSALIGRYPAGAQMMVCDPLARSGVQRLFHCHPPLARRVQALRSLAGVA